MVAAMLEGVPLRNSRRLSAFTRTKMAALAAARLVSPPARLGSPLPRLHREWAHPCRICTETGLTPATSALGLGVNNG